MFSATNGPMPAAEQTWRLFARPDLIVRRQVFREEITWVVKDPIRLKYYYFRNEEYAVLKWLDGRTSLLEIQERFAGRFTPSRLTRAELQQFVHQLHQNGLVIADTAGQGQVLVESQRKRRRWAWLTGLGSILCLRFRGFDPDRLLTWLHQWLRWIFTPAAAISAMLSILAGLSVVMLHFGQFRHELPSAREALTPANLVAMATILCVVKVLHEFGHGLSCKHFGGECHELGLMMLVLTPCLYCNVSDSLLLESKWRRVAIAFAGIYVELFLAAAATFLWWFSHPGPLHHLAILMMVYCSVSTIVFNGNPLMRYDGYFVLAELLEIPNLRHRASEALRRWFLQHALGFEFPLDPRMPTGWAGAGLWLYAIVSEVYRWLVTASVLWFLYRFLAPFRLELLGQILAAGSIGGLILVPVWKLGRFLTLPGSFADVRRKNLLVTLAIVAGLAVALVALPLPHRVVCPAQTQPGRAESVYVELPGTLTEILVTQGQSVERGQRLARLDDIEIDLVLDELVGQRDNLQTRLLTLRRQRGTDPSIAAQLPEVETALSTIEDQVKEKESQREKLLLQAPQDGIVWAPSTVSPPQEVDRQLPGWHGSPLERRNLRAYLPVGTMFCQVGPPAVMEAELIVDQADIELVQRGQRVDLQLAALPFERLRGTVDEIAEPVLFEAPRQLSSKSGGDLASQTDAFGRERPISTSYQVRVSLDRPHAALRPGNSGEARIHVGYRPIATRVWRWLQHTFYFRT